MLLVVSQGQWTLQQQEQLLKQQQVQQQQQWELRPSL
jgi:hypothetical protein